MNRFVSFRSLAASLAAAVCLWPVAASAQAQDVPSPGSVATVDQVRGAFANAGFQVDQTLTWDWTSPPVSTLQIHDAAHGRVLLALVYPDAAAAQTGRLQAQAHEQDQNPGDAIVSGYGPHLVIGYGQSVWQGNVALVQTTQSELDRNFRLQNERDNGVYVEPDVVQEPDLPNFAVDLDFQQALENGAVNL